MSSQQYTGMIHAYVCVWEGGMWGVWVCLASVSGPMCIFVFVIRVTARRFSLPKDKIKSCSLEFLKSVIVGFLPPLVTDSFVFKPAICEDGQLP